MHKYIYPKIFCSFLLFSAYRIQIENEMNVFQNQSNFFAALDDSGDEAEIVKKSTKVKKEKVSTTKAPVAEPSKPNHR